jgi:hypothetical protein
MRINRAGIFIVLLLLTYGCRCPRGFYIDNGKSWRKTEKLDRFTDIKDKDFVISVHKYDKEITVNYLTKFSAPYYIKDRGVKITFRQVLPSLDTKVELVRHERESLVGYTDSILKNRAKEEYFTCENFQKEIKKSKKLYLKVIYQFGL